MRMIFLAIVFCVQTAWAKDKKTAIKTEGVPVMGEVHFKKKIDPGELQAQLVAAGFSVSYINCSQDNCTIHMSATEKKDPMPIVQSYVYIDPMVARKEKLARMRALYDKWQANTIVPAEKDELLKMLVGQVLGK